MTELKKLKKKQLIKLIENYESDIRNLQDEIVNLSLMEPTINREIIVIDKENDDKTMIYLKNRIRVVQDPHRRQVYIMELDRIRQLTEVN